MNVLLSAFACDPHFGSDEEVGWQWARALSRLGHHVWVLTRTSHRDAIEAERVRTGDCRGVHFVYVDASRAQAWLARFNRRGHVYCYLWQWLAYRRARQIARAHRLDVVHHVTWVSFRQPSFMGLLRVPFIFGPVAGGDEIPAGYAQRLSYKERVVEATRSLANAFVRFDPLMRMTYRQAACVFVTSPAHLSRLPNFVVPRTHVELAIGSSGVTPAAVRRRHSTGSRVLSVGRALGLKGMDYGLEVFAKALARRPDLRLSIVGDGEAQPRWQALARQLGVAHAIDWVGWLPKSEVLELYTSYDVLLYPSLRDSGGFVVLEALQAGLPVVCFRLAGPGVIVDDAVGAAIDPTPDLNATTTQFAKRLLEVLDRATRDPSLEQACRDRARHFSWDALVQRVYDSIPIATGGVG